MKKTCKATDSIPHPSCSSFEIHSTFVPKLADSILCTYLVLHFGQKKIA